MSSNHTLGFYRFATASLWTETCDQRHTGVFQKSPSHRSNILCPWIQIFNNKSIDENRFDDFDETEIETHLRRKISVSNLVMNRSEYSGGEHDRDEDLAEVSGDAKATASDMAKDTAEIGPDNDDEPNA